jgi:hypothetical protein
MELGDYDDDSTFEETPEKEPISPPSGAESLFLAGLATTRLNAVALSETIKTNHRNRSLSADRSLYSAKSMTTDDFASCAETEEDIDYMMDFTSPRHPVLPGLEEEGTGDMTTTYSNAKYALPGDVTPVKPAMKSSAPAASSESEPLKIDAAEVAYNKAKDVWAWGKTVPVVSFLVGTTEAVASKAIAVVGIDFATIDEKIASELGKLDAGVLNPALEAIAKVLISVADKSEGSLKPFILAILKPLGMIKSEAAEATPDAHSPPEVTTKMSSSSSSFKK